MQVIASWTGGNADVLRQSLRMTYESFAGRLDVSVRTVAYWRKRPEMIPTGRVQEILDATLERASDREKAQFALLIGQSGDSKRTGHVEPFEIPGGGLLRASSDAEAQFGDPEHRIRTEAEQRGSDASPMEEGARYPADTDGAVALLDALAGADMADRPEVMREGWATETAPSVITGYLFSSPAWQDAQAVSDAASTSADRIRAFTRHLMDLDFQFGGGHVRRLLLFYFRTEIVPLLREPNPDPIRREIFSAAAEAVQLLGWSAYDSGRHGAAQRYFMQGLRLAQEAGDLVLGGWLLSSLSHQANYLGRYNEALQFARAAQTSAAGRATPTVNAMLLAMEARALASSGDSQTCAQVLHRAEQAFARRDSDTDPSWISYFDALELAGEAAHCFRELGQPRETQLFAAQAIDPAGTPPRTRAFISMVTAAGAFKAGNLDEALSLAAGAVSLTGSLQSSRYIRYLTDFHQSLTGLHAADPAVRRFTELLTRTYPTLRF